MGPEVVTIIDLVRHAHADWQPDEGRPLSARGRIGAEAVATLLRDRPIAAVYSSPARRAIQTVEGLGIEPVVIEDLREREWPPVFTADFQGIIRDAWANPSIAPAGAESNATAQERGLAVIRTLLVRHAGRLVVVGTHGNLLALILNGLDSTLGYEFWRSLTFPDVYELTFEGDALASVARIFDDSREAAQEGTA